MKLSIIIPVFNEEQTIVPILKKLDDVEIPYTKKEIIIVDDGSTDATAIRIKHDAIRDINIKVITHKKNQGKGAAIQTGIKYASGDYIIIQDADLEYNPRDILRLILPVIRKETEVVYGTRLKRIPHFQHEEQNPRFFLHYIGNRFLSFITSLLYGQWITDMETCYKLFPRNALVNIQLRSKRFDFEPEITAKLLKNGYRILEIPIATKPRGYLEGKKLHTFRDGSIALWTLVKYRFLD